MTSTKMAGFAVGQIAKSRNILNCWSSLPCTIKKRVFLTHIWPKCIASSWKENCSNFCHSPDVKHLQAPHRRFFSFPGEHIKSRRRQEYSTRKLIGFSKEKLYHIVSHVEDYKEFVPWCRDSTVFVEKSGHKKCKLEIGFPPLVERYISVLTLVPPSLVVSECTQGELFNYMKTTWRFSPGLKDNPETTLVDFQVAFEFRSTLHSHLSSMFFDEVVKKMVGAFEKRCAQLYGPSSLTSRQRPKRRRKVLGVSHK